jgi:hypothetical protein
MAKRRSTKRSKGAAGNISYDQVLEVAAKLKNAIETRSKKDIDGLLASSAIWLSNKPSDAKGLFDAIVKLTGNASDVEFSLTKLENAEVSDKEVSIEADAQLIWTNDETWEEKETSFKLYLGMIKVQDTWSIKYLSISPSIKISGPLTFGMPTGEPYFGEGIRMPGAPYFSEELLRAPYFAEYFAAPYFEAEKKLGAFGFAEEPKHVEAKPEIPSFVPVYMPVLVPSSFLKKLFDK